MKVYPLLLILSSFLWSSCDKSTSSPDPAISKTEFAEETWEFESEFFKLQLPSTWKKEDPESLNRAAKFAASLDDIFFILIIPQKLPEIPGVPIPDALALKRASLNIMRMEDKELEIESEGPAKIGGVIAQSVIASGVVDGKKIQYVTSYITIDTLGIQIIALGPHERGKTLIKEADILLSRFEILEKNIPTENDKINDTTLNKKNRNNRNPKLPETDKVDPENKTKEEY